MHCEDHQNRTISGVARSMVPSTATSGHKSKSKFAITLQRISLIRCRRHNPNFECTAIDFIFSSSTNYSNILFLPCFLETNIHKNVDKANVIFIQQINIISSYVKYSLKDLRFNFWESFYEVKCSHIVSRSDNNSGKCDWYHTSTRIGHGRQTGRGNTNSSQIFWTHLPNVSRARSGYHRPAEHWVANQLS